MSPSEGGSKFVIEGDFLFVRGQLGIEDERPYSEALFKLVNSGHDMVHVDFSALDYVSSSYIGATGLMIMMAMEKNVVPNLIVNEKVARTFQLAGLDQMVNMRIVNAKKE